MEGGFFGFLALPLWSFFPLQSPVFNFSQAEPEKQGFGVGQMVEVWCEMYHVLLGSLRPRGMNSVGERRPRGIRVLGVLHRAGAITALMWYFFE